MGLGGLGKILSRSEVNRTSNASTGSRTGKSPDGRIVSTAKPSLWARFKRALGFSAKISNPVISGGSSQRIHDQYKGNFIKAGPGAKHPGGFVSADKARAKAEMDRFEALTNKLEDREIRSDRPSILQETEKNLSKEVKESKSTESKISVSNPAPSEEVKESKSTESKISISNPVPSGKTIQKLQDQYKGNFIEAGPDAKHPQKHKGITRD